jgi:hypothetical protein
MKNNGAAVEPEELIDRARDAQAPRVIEKLEWWDDRVYRRILADGTKPFKWSVTTKLGIINKPFLSRWRGDLGNYEADKRSNFAKWRGSRVHDAIHRLIMDGEVVWEQNTVDALGQDEWLKVLYFKKFLRLFKPVIKGSETIVWSEAGNYAGTMDLPVLLTAGEYQITKSTVVTVPETGYYCGDIKTGNLSKEYNYQTAAYAMAEEAQADPQSEIFSTVKEYGEPLGTFILHLDADNKEGWTLKLRTKENMAHDYEMALLAFRLWDDVNPNKTPAFFEMPTKITLIDEEA